MKKYELTVHGMKPLFVSDWPPIEAAIKSLRKNGIGYVVLGFSDNDYVQCAGTTEALTVEFRKVVSETDFIHTVLGRSDRSPKSTTLQTAVGPINLYSNEILKFDDALAIFRHYFEHQEVPSEYHRRDDTARFTQ